MVEVVCEAPRGVSGEASGEGEMLGVLLIFIVIGLLLLVARWLTTDPGGMTGTPCRTDEEWEQTKLGDAARWAEVRAVVDARNKVSENKQESS